MKLPHKKELKWLVIGIIAASILVGLNLAAKRYQFESQNDTVQMAMSLTEVSRLSKLGGLDQTKLLSRLSQEANISAIVVDEGTLASYEAEGKLTILKGSDIMNMLRVGKVYRTILTRLASKTQVKPDRIYVVVDEFNLYEQIKGYLIATLETGSVKERGWNILEILSDERTLMNVGLGFAPETAKELSGHGLTMIPRFQNGSRRNDALIKLKFKNLSQLSDVKVVLFEEESVLGYPSHLETVSSELKSAGIAIGFEEFSKQLGIYSLTKITPRNVVRVHSITPETMSEMTESVAITRYLRSAKERGARLLLFQPLINLHSGNEIVDYNISMAKDISTYLSDFGFKIGSIGELPTKQFVPVSAWESFIMSAGILVWLLLFLQLAFPIRKNLALVLSVIFIFGFAILSGLGSLTVWNRIMALLAACVFPTYAIISLFPSGSQKSLALKNRFRKAHFYILSTVGITLVGAIYVVGFMVSIPFLMGINQFFGVKISFLFPVVAVGLYFYLRPNRIPALYFVIKRLFTSPLSIGALLASLVSLIFVVVYILRSGNYLNIPFIETWMRNTLESLLFVRPRTKEFLIGIPLLMVGYMFVDSKISREWVWFFNALGAVALISILNSFCHVHTPLIISLYRSVIGVVFGFLFAWLYIAVFAGIKLLFRRLA
ncbi:MAG: DUF5693 family protein [bacterium]|nr:DUF5693 family protein [bacterium]